MRTIGPMVLVAMLGCGDNVVPDAAGSLVITAAPGLATSEATGIATFTVALTAAPARPVTIAVASSDTGEGTVSPPSLAFTPDNFGVPITVTVTGVDDHVDDGDQLYAVTVDGGALGHREVAVTNLDNDGVGVSVTAAAGLTTTEAGGAASFTVALDAEPAAVVTIPVGSADPTEGAAEPSSLTFTPSNWNAPQVVTVTGANDALADGAIDYTITLGAAESTDPLYAGLDPADVAVTNIDDDSPGVVVTPSAGLVTTEAGGAAMFSVVLAAQPTADVTIGVASSDPGEGAVDRGSLTFTGADWNAPQFVSVTGADDPFDDGDQSYTIVLAPVVSADPGYQGLDPPDVAVTNVDDEAPGFIVTPTTGLVTSETGGTATFTVALVSRPTAPVTVAVSSADPTEGSPFPTTLTFSPLDFDVSQTVTVTGADDLIADGNQVYRIVVGAASSADPAYDALDPPDVTVSNTDNDTPGITVAPTAGLLVSELGDTATFTIVLNSEPTANVTIAIAVSDATEGLVAPPSVTFTPTDWFTPRTITVTGKDDLVADGNQPFTIITAPAVSADPRYGGLNPANVAVVNLDNDTASVIVDAEPLLPVSENGTTAMFTMRLTTQPIANVTCAVASSDPGEGTVAPGSVVFTPLNFATPQPVTVTGVDDAIVDGAQLFLIVTASCVSADPAYNNFNPRDVSCRNSDND